MKSNIYKNIIMNILLQVVTIISGFILPRLFLSFFGSEVNGLVSSISQFLNYITLLEGGVTGVMTASLYKPLYDGDIKKISSIVMATRNFFKKISYVFAIYTLILAIVYPLCVKSSFTWSYIFLLTLILGINLFVQYNFSFSLKILLTADNQIYKISLVQSIVVILNTISVYVGIHIFPNIHIIKLITLVVYFIQPITYTWMVKNSFNLDVHAKPDEEALSQRWNGFGINIAYFIHSNTDLVLLSLFVSLKSVSVYTTYLLVINGIKSLISAVSSSFSATVGQFVAKGSKDELTNIFEMIEFFLNFIVYVSYTIVAIVIVPFVMLYTKGITDTNYYQPLFAIVMVIAEFMYSVREPYVLLAYQANHFKQFQNPALYEAIINIVISVFLVRYIGILGVAIGTLVAMAYRTLYQVYYLKDHIIQRKMKYFWKYTIIYGGSSVLLFYVLNTFIQFNYSTILVFLIDLIEMGIIIFIAFLVVSIIFFRKEFITLYNYVRSK